MERTQTHGRCGTVRRALGRAVAIVAVVVAGTYGFTRAVSPWTALRVVSDEGISAPASSAVTAGEGAAVGAQALRVGCYNIAHGRGSGEKNWNGADRATRDARLTEIASFLRDADLDVVVLNEVDFDAAWSGGVNQAAVLAARAGYPHRVEQRNFDVAVPFFALRFGNAVLSRHPIVEAHLVDLPGDAAWETLLAGKKNGAVATIELPGGRRVRVFAVHLSYRSEPVRCASARAMRREAARSSVPMIVAGDFNSTLARFPGADPSGLSALDDLLAGGEWTTLPAGPPESADFTFSSTEPDRVIDWILAPKPWRIASRRVDAVEFSDHRPVIAALLSAEGRPGR